MTDFDKISCFFANPPYAFKMPFLIVSEVLKGDIYFAEYFGGFKKAPACLINKKISMNLATIPVEIPSHYFSIPGFLSTQAQTYGLEALQFAFENLSQSSSDKFLQIKLQETASPQMFSMAQMFLNSEVITKITNMTESKSLRVFMQTLSKLPLIEFCD